MGKFKDEGNPSLALAEECSEVIKVIMKKHRFEQSWDSNPPSSTETRWEELEGEMEDVLYQWERTKRANNKSTNIPIRIDRIADFMNLLDDGEKVQIQYVYGTISYYEVTLPRMLYTESFLDSCKPLIESF